MGDFGGKGLCLGLTWDGWVAATSPPQWRGAKVRGMLGGRMLEGCQPAGPGRGGCFRRGLGLFDGAETTQWLVVSHVSLERRGVMRYIPFACLCSGLMWSCRANQSFCFEGGGGGRDRLCSALWRALEILQPRRLHPSLPLWVIGPRLEVWLCHVKYLIIYTVNV